MTTGLNHLELAFDRLFENGDQWSPILKTVFCILIWHADLADIGSYMWSSPQPVLEVVDIASDFYGTMLYQRSRPANPPKSKPRRKLDSRLPTPTSPPRK